MARAERNRARARYRSDTERGRRLSVDRADRRLAVGATALTLAVAASVVAAIDPTGPVGWSHQLSLLWFVLAAGASRALLGSPKETPASAPAHGPLRIVIPGLLIGVAAVAPYLHGLTIGFLSDDFGIVAAARAAQGPLDIVRLRPYPLFYRPLSEVLWWAGVQLWGGAPMGYHLLNLTVHAANSLLVYLLGCRLFSSYQGALFAGLLFAAHPAHVEPVIWSCCQPDLLAACCSLLSLLLVEAFLTGRSVSVRAVALSGALAAFALALVSKESAVGLPGVVALRLALAPGEGRLWRAVRVGGSYAGVLAAFLAWRFFVVGGMGGYGHSLQPWEVIFPSAPLRQLAVFLFPLNRDLLLEAGGPLCLGVLVVLMSGGALWWARRTIAIPADRLWFYVGYLVMMSVPVWTLSTRITRDLEGTRLVYIPTIALAWIFGDLCRSSRSCGRGATLLSIVTIIVAGTLAASYVTPWRRADSVAKQVLAAGRNLAEALPPTDSNLVLFVQGLPEQISGAQVFRNGFDAALRGVVHRPVVVHTVGSGASSEALPEVLRSSDLLPGEYDLVWRNETGVLDILRAGGPPPSSSTAEGIP